LEDWVGARLMHRTTRKLSLTAAGSETLPRCRQMLELCSDMQAAVSEPDEAPRGLLRLSVSTSFGQAQLADAMAEYVKRYPLVNIDMQMLDRTVNLVDERIDLAIRTSFELDPNLIARRLTLCRSVICASPAYLLEHPQPRQVQDLARHNCLTHSYFGKSLWHFMENGEPVSVPVQGNISANEASTLLRVTLAGAGVSRLPSYQAGDYIRSGELIRLLPEAEPQQMNIYAVYASRKHMPAALRSLLDFLVLRFPEEPVWDVGL
ncbi:LysR family transcriptional regulator, partial [Pseudomonas sp. K5002]